ncbi:MAG: hypothetical protein CL578_02170 [Alteromonadaceae bacterium]|jgi:predicted GNAT family acetyltransferase|uniref:GNAT family N-acetyltransferase n=1 Tax=Paraglaciecola chathamensis TaxID=368405 RepID=UPI000C520009|nr:GNAT family N-acetyltransferase [Paraglaciecola agarilytica]MBN23837.1 hypothetical protein [Alteromonadaceae bacterium]
MNPFITKNCMNLTALWHCYGAKKENDLWFSTDWPHRVWHDSLAKTVTLHGLQKSQLNPKQQLVMLDSCNGQRDQLPEGLKADVSLTLMHLLVSESCQSLRPGSDLEWLARDDELGIQAFVEMCSEGFGYPMDIAPLQRCAEKAGGKLGFLRSSGERVATVLLFQQGSTLGVYQVAVPNIHRGKGYASEVMRHCILWAQEHEVELITLQASEMGLSLYRRLGFQEVGSITLWRK